MFLQHSERKLLIFAPKAFVSSETPHEVTHHRSPAGGSAVVRSGSFIGPCGRFISFPLQIILCLGGSKVLRQQEAGLWLLLLPDMQGDHRRQTSEVSLQIRLNPGGKLNGAALAMEVLKSGSESRDEFTAVVPPGRVIRLPVVDIVDLVLGVAVGPGLVACLPVRLVLRSDVCPISAENFVNLGLGYGSCKGKGFESRRRSYVQQGSGVYAAMPGEYVAAGDVHGLAGRGGECAVNDSRGPGRLGAVWRSSFDDENHAVSTAHSGTVFMAQSGPHDNRSSFIVSLKPNRELQGRSVAFGHVLRGGDALVSISELQIGSTGGLGPKQSEQLVQCAPDELISRALFRHCDKHR